MKFRNTDLSLYYVSHVSWNKDISIDVTSKIGFEFKHWNSKLRVFLIERLGPPPSIARICSSESAYCRTGTVYFLCLSKYY